MPEHKSGALPSPEAALAGLKQLAEAFFQSGPRAPDELLAGLVKTERRSFGVVLVDESGRVAGIDREAEEHLDRRAAELIGSPAEELFGALPILDESRLNRVRRSDGTERPLWVTRSELTFGSDRCTALRLHEHDSVGRMRAELRYRHLVEQIPAVVFTAALDGGLHDLYISPQIERLLGYSQAQWVADPVLWYERLHPEDRPKLDAEFARGCASGGPFRADCRFLTRDDRVVWVHGEARLIKSASGAPLLLQGIAFDITETKRAEEITRASLREKETLLREIHHRVKNNLQVSSSLLKLQTDRIENESAKNALREARDRIRSMALVHELLYRSKDLSKVNLGDYVHDLTQQLVKSHAAGTGHVRVETSLVAVPLPIDVAVPCGLILNELVSNALKHAFPSGRPGVVAIELRRAEGFDELVVRDDGIGMASGIDFQSGPALGLRLVKALADQIGGRLVASSKPSVEVRLQIPRSQEQS